MEISPQLMQQLQLVFKAELAEHIETLTTGLLALEKGTETDQQQELLESIFRAAHSLKGSAFGEGMDWISLKSCSTSATSVL